MPNCIHKVSLYLQIYTDFCPWYFQTIKTDRLHHTMSCVHHLHYTNWRLKICMWQLYFSSWSPEGNLRIFLILSPVSWNLKLLKFVFPSSHKNCFFGVFSYNLLHLCQKECNDWNYFGTRFLSTENKKLLNFLKDSILIQIKRFIFKNYHVYQSCKEDKEFTEMSRKDFIFSWGDSFQQWIGLNAVQ